MRRYLENCRSIRLAVFLVISEFLNEHFSFEHVKAILIGIDAKVTKWNLLAESIPANTTKAIPKAYIILASKPAQNNSLSQAVRSFANRFRLTARKDTLKI